MNNANTTTPPKGYKKTTIGIIPENWEVKKLGDYANVIMGQSPSSTSYNENGDGFYLIQGNADIKDRFSAPRIWTNEPTKLCEEGDILMSVRAPVGTISKSKHAACIGRGICAIKSKEKINQEFLYNFLLSFESQWKSLEQGSTFTAVNSNDIKNLQLPIPPQPEQKKIAAILSTWDKAIDNCKEIIDNLKIRNIGLAQQLLSGKMRLKDFRKSQWHLKSVEEVAVFKNGKAHENCIDEDGDYFVVNSKFISTQGKVFKSSNQNLCPLFKNDVTLVMSDVPNGKALAKCFYIPVDDKYTLNQRICALTAKDGTDSKFLYYQMNRNNYYLSFNNGVSQTNLKKEEVLECPLLMPDIEEQIQIVKVIDTATKELNQYEHKLETLQFQKKGLMQQLLTGKIRVNVK